MEDIGVRWHKFPILTIPSKYYKVKFQDTSGEEDSLAVRQIRFVRARERSATIIKHPSYHIMNNDVGNISMPIGNRKNIELRVEADSWPPPTYQWFMNGRAVAGATKDRIIFQLYCASSHEQRAFRCMKCKLVSKSVPINAYNVICGNCGKLFAFKEITEYMVAIKELIAEESIVKSELTRREELLQQMEASSDLEFRGKMGTITEFIKEDLKALEKFRERRTMLKFALEYTNKFTNEGVYTCRVRSIRGGSLVIEKWTNPAAVVVEQPEPFHLKVTSK